MQKKEERKKMKKLRNVVVCVVSMLCCINKVVASDDGVFVITNKKDFQTCLEKESICRVGNDLSLDQQMQINHDLILDLNGKRIESIASMKLTSGLLMVERGAKLTINDSKGNGTISTGPSGNVWAAIQLIKENNGSDTAELEINGGIIEGYYYGITGNGNYHNTKITINDGTIKGLNEDDSAGIYQPQRGTLLINNGTIQGGTGIEIRSGSLTIKGGTISGIAPKFIKTVNKAGTTTNGVGVAVAQHTTKNPIQVEIYNGSINGQYAFYEWNPHGNPKADIDNIKLHIYGGTFLGTATGVSTIYSEDFKHFVSGGSFNKDIQDYLDSNATINLQNKENKTTMFQKEGKNIFFLPILFFIISIATISGIYLYKKKQILFR